MNKSETNPSTGQGATPHQTKFRTIGKYTIDFGKFLGSGKYGKVYPAFYMAEYENQQRYACKMIEFPGQIQSSKQSEESKEQNPAKNKQIEQMQKQFSMEVEALMAVNSPHVMRLIKAYKSKDRQYLITELCNGGDLNSLVTLRGRIPEDEAKIILKQIVIGLKDISAVHIVHRDMKCANILLHFPNTDLLSMRKLERQEFIRKANLREIPFEIKISDFGFARQINGKNKDGDRLTICGTPAYMAPTQMVNHEYLYTEKLDIYSLGVIYYELLVGTPPFMGRNVEELKRKLKDGNYVISDKINISPESILLISKCLQYAEIDRVTIQELAKDPLFTAKNLNSPMKSQNMQNSVMSTSETSVSALKKKNSNQSVTTNSYQKRNQIILSIKQKYTIDKIQELLYGQYSPDQYFKKFRNSDQYIKASTSSNSLPLASKIKKKEMSNAIDPRKNDFLLDSDITCSWQTVCCKGYDIIVKKMINDNYFKK